jgi:choline dehydrogenase-like flavoprotein
MGANRHKSVVDFDLRTHDLDDLYIMDASVIPDSLGVNPQVTIMALAMRAASRLAEKLA